MSGRCLPLTSLSVSVDLGVYVEKVPIMSDFGRVLLPLKDVLDGKLTFLEIDFRPLSICLELPL